jgi:transcriptional regulator with XRE-family HTH domain
MTTAATAVRAIREATGKTRAEFGAAINVSARRVGQVEGGTGTFRSASIVTICELYRRQMVSLGITPLDFMRVG